MLCGILVLNGWEEVFVLEVLEGFQCSVVLLLPDEIVGLVNSMKNAQRASESI